MLVPALTFVAPANAIRYCGAHPVFMDAEPGYWQMDAGKVACFLEQECVWKRGALHNRATAAIARDDLLRFLGACGHEPQIVDLA